MEKLNLNINTNFLKMLNEKPKADLKVKETFNKNSLSEEKNFNNNLISYFILNDKGTIILARQFQSITKSELFYHAAFFHQFLRGFDQENKPENSFFDNKGFRYVYFPLDYCNNENESLISVLLIKKDYNIFSAINTIKLIQRMINEIIKNKDRENQNYNTTDNVKGKVRYIHLIII